MADIKVISNTVVRCDVHLRLSEEEARALEAICGYGPDEFVKWFYRNLGEHYLKPHEEGMRSLFATVKYELPKQLNKINKVREFIKNN